MKHRNLPFILLLFALVSAQKVPVTNKACPDESIPRLSWGMIQRFPELKSKYIGSRTVDVLLPEEYAGYPAMRYPVLYMHDGQMLFDSSETWNKQEWKVDECLREIYKASGKTCIVVAIHNSGARRYAEYFPQKPFQKLNKSGKEQVLKLAEKDQNRLFPDSLPTSDNYLRFITEELKPMVDESFRTKADRKNTWIAGSSMGGLISLYALCEYPKIFGAAAGLSTHWPGIFSNRNNPVPAAFLSYLDQKIPRRSDHRLLLLPVPKVWTAFTCHITKRLPPYLGKQDPILPLRVN